MVRNSFPPTSIIHIGLQLIDATKNGKKGIPPLPIYQSKEDKEIYFERIYYVEFLSLYWSFCSIFKWVDFCVD